MGRGNDRRFGRRKIQILDDLKIEKDIWRSKIDKNGGRVLKSIPE